MWFIISRSVKKEVSKLSCLPSKMKFKNGPLKNVVENEGGTNFKVSPNDRTSDYTLWFIKKKCGGGLKVRKVAIHKFWPNFTESLKLFFLVPSLLATNRD